MSGAPQDSTHLSDVDVSLLLDEYGGEVEAQFAKASIMRQYAKVRVVRNTDTIVNNRVGRTKIGKLVPGVRPDANKTAFGKVALTVDTVVIARDNRSMLNELQTHFDARMELATDHGKELGKFFDEAFIIQTIKGSLQSAPTGAGGASLNGAFGAGKNVTLDQAGDELDPDKMYDAITEIITDMEEDETDVEELVVFVRPKTYKVLLNNDKLMSRDFSPSNGDFAKGKIMTIDDARIVKTSRIPKAVITDHLLSNEANSAAYDVSASEAKAVAVIMHPKSLLAGETIPLTSDIWFDKKEKQWFIDSFLSFAVTVNRADTCGAVFKA